MGKNRLFFLSVLCLISTVISSTAVEGSGLMSWWENRGASIKDSDLWTVVVSAGHPAVMYVSSRNVVHRSNDGGETWRDVLSFMGEGTRIHEVTTPPGSSEVVLAATGSGLYRSGDGGSSWQRIYKGVGRDENEVFSVSVDPRDPAVIVIGTGAGLFLTGDGGRHWNRSKGLSSSAVVTATAFSQAGPDLLYAATLRGLFVSDDDAKSWRRVYAMIRPQSDKGNSDSEPVSEGEEREISPLIRTIALHPENRDCILLGTSEGLVTTEDGGRTWSAAGSEGLPLTDIRQVRIADYSFTYAATSRGLYEYSRSSRRWTELYRGLPTKDIRSVAVSSVSGSGRPLLWVATGKGLFRSVPPEGAAPDEGISPGDILASFTTEPTIDEIRQAAMTYAEVHPEKISRWRRAASRRALLPDLRFDYHKNHDWQSSTYFYKDTYQEEYLKDNDITRDRDREWGITLTWKLGDLIWNNDQTSIDSRSRLMVQLRDDLLSEVTRLYYERRRLQADMYLNPSRGPRESIDRALRLEELTANIDSLTGSYLSRRLARGAIPNLPASVLPQ